MFHVDWKFVASDAAIDTVRAAAGFDGPGNDTLRPLVASILSHVGGFPVTDEKWSESHRTDVALRLLHEAVGRALRVQHGRRPTTPGCALVDSEGPLERTVEYRRRVDVNAALAEELEPLPVLGPKLAQRTLAERLARGAFRDTADLAARVHGLGEVGASELEAHLWFGDPQRSSSAKQFSNELKSDLALLLALHPDGNDPKRWPRALEALATYVAAEPHPATAHRRIRSELSPSEGREPQRTVEVDAVAVLEDEAYYPALLDLLDRAKARVDVAMFFIAMPSAEHPSAKLLEKLVSLAERGVDVRVLVDRDREEDPYGSTLINADAVEFLRSKGVPVRVDREDNLLHSKVVAIDGARVVVGSHNWTVGSFRRYHDTSVVLEGGTLPSVWHKRFEGLWAGGEAPG